MLDTMSDTARYSRLYWRCRRGMLELDLLLGRFIQGHIHNLSASEIETFESLLAYPDTQLFEYLMGRCTPVDIKMAHIIEKIRYTAAD